MYSTIDFFDDYIDILIYIDGSGDFFDSVGSRAEYDIYVIDGHGILMLDRLKYKVVTRVYGERRLQGD